MTQHTRFYFETFAEWRDALTRRCGIELTPAYARQRLAALRDPADPTTREFTAKYGQAYLDQVVAWFERAARRS